ncbi:hypothetical protein E4U53_001786 [Claviceps sorghi]|nr:hypothetical protein E4U53_001786 [Claviceps sorghi]
MNSSMPAGAASSTIFPERSSVNGVHDALEYVPSKRRFLAKRTPRPKPQFIRARFKTPCAPQSSNFSSAQPKIHVPPSPSRGEYSQHHDIVSEKKNDAGHAKEIQLLSLANLSHTSGNAVIRSSCEQPRRKPRANRLDQDEMIEYAITPPEDPTSRHEPKASRRNDQKGSVSAPLVIDLTQNNDLLDDDTWTLNAIPRIVAQKINSSPCRRRRSLLPQPVFLEDSFVDLKEARPTASTSDQKSTEATFGNRPLHEPLQSKAEATKGTFNTEGVRKRFTRSLGMTGLSKGARESGPGAQHDQLDLDAAIYGQPGAALPPPGVKIRRQMPYKTRGPDEKRRYIHANPAIHLLHNRSATWHARKASEIENRLGRKSWIGNVSGRLRWLRTNKEVLRPSESDKREDANGINERLPRRRDVKPSVQPRALDFGDVPEDELPDYVQQNPAWLKACAFFRQTKERREARARASKICEQETRAFFDMMIHVDGA